MQPAELFYSYGRDTSQLFLYKENVHQIDQLKERIQHISPAVKCCINLFDPSLHWQRC